MPFGLQCAEPTARTIFAFWRKHIVDAIDAPLRRLFDIDVLACPQCGGRLRLIAAVEDPDATRAILAALATSRERRIGRRRTHRCRTSVTLPQPALENPLDASDAHVIMQDDPDPRPHEAAPDLPLQVRPARIRRHLHRLGPDGADNAVGLAPVPWPSRLSPAPAPAGAAGSQVQPRSDPRPHDREAPHDAAGGRERASARCSRAPRRPRASVTAAVRPPAPGYFSVRAYRIPQ